MVMPTLRSLKQDNYEFKDCVTNFTRPCLKTEGLDLKPRGRALGHV